jgi:hypothetical protein
VGHSAKNFSKKIFLLCRVPCKGALDKEIFKKKLFPLPSAKMVSTRQRIFQTKRLFFFAECHAEGHSAKFKKNKKFFAECLAEGHTAKNLLTCRALSWQLFFAECRRDTRQSLCRVPDKKHSTKRSLPMKFLSCTLC